MTYRHETARTGYSDYASGRVLYSLPGRPAFPVRLGLEILRRCQAVRAAGGASGPALLYDPCCGGAYLLTVLALLCPELLRGVVASDIDPDALALARRNLALLTVAGMDRRIEQLQELSAAYGKTSHA